MAARRRLAAHDSGKDIWNRVVKAGDEGLSRVEAMGRYMSAQFEKAKDWIRDCQPANTKKFVCVDGRYMTTNGEDQEGE
ncbi:hypothetical protein ACH4GP_16860 [Streptomyces celluloflavus]|uniref:Transposase n=1 Tax=Streptomyces celluloflavus TaxID=58344 RepID=A0ABW7RI77_9ACTN